VTERLRAATQGDLDAMLGIKHALRVQREDPGAGGFLLGASEPEYAAMIEFGVVEILEHAGEPVGFAIAARDAAVRASDLWRRRLQVRWRGLDPASVEHERVAYFDQLAVRPGVRMRAGAAALALRVVLRLLAEGHRHVFATTVLRPIDNRAAWGLLARIGGVVVGELDEVHPAIGPLVSAVHHASADRILAALDRAERCGGPAVRRTLALARL
jgi:fructose-1,6-bisphosphatase/inositol monophosphatase family enzyme